jgi:peptide chain release factor 3
VRFYCVEIGRKIVLSNTTVSMAEDRTNVEEVWPEDIIGIYNHRTVQISDTLTKGIPLQEPSGHQNRKQSPSRKLIG